MNIAFFASSLVSAYWNGAATYYRGIIRALHERGYDITFYEPDAYGRQSHRDMPDPEWARVVVYPADDAGVLRALEAGRGADFVVKTSGVGVFDELLEAAVPNLKGPDAVAIYWDVDAPATLDRIRNNPADPFVPLIPFGYCSQSIDGHDLISRSSTIAKCCVTFWPPESWDLSLPRLASSRVI